MKRILAKPRVASAAPGTVLAHVFSLRRWIARADTPQLPANIPLAAEPLLAFVTHSSHARRVQRRTERKRGVEMKVKDLMKSDVKTCTQATNLAAAAKIMWEGDCGAIPVIDERGAVVGMITDRDICIAAATRSRMEGDIPVQEVISKTLYTCTPGDDVRAALDTMRSRKVRRLPVVGHDGKLAGILSLHDIALQARSSRNQELMPDAVLDTFVAITAPSTPVLA